MIVQAVKRALEQTPPELASDIAETIASVIRRIQAGEIDKIPPITQLSEIRVTTNDDVLRKHTVARTADRQ